MHGYNNVYHQSPRNAYEAQLERDAIARQQAQLDQYARAARANAAANANAYRMPPQMFQGMDDDSDEDDFITRLQRRDQRAPQTQRAHAPAGFHSDDMDVDAPQARAAPQFPTAQAYPYPQPQPTSFPQPQAASLPPPPPHEFAASHMHAWATHDQQQLYEQQQLHEQRYQQQQQQLQQQQLAALHASAMRIQRAWRRFLFLRNWRRSSSLRQLSTLRAKFDSLVQSFAPPDVLEYSVGDATQQLPTHGVPYARFVRLSSDAQAGMERALAGGRVPPLAFTPATRAVLGLGEELARLLSALDAVPSWGDGAVRDARKQLASAVEGEAARLDAWARVVWCSARAAPAPAAGFGGAAPTMPEPAHQAMPEPPRQPRRSTPPSMAELLKQQARQPRRSYPQDPAPPPPMPEPPRQPRRSQPPQQDPASPMGQLAALRTRFERALGDFAAPDVLEYTLQPARAMGGALELIGRINTSFLPHASFVRPSTAANYSGPPLAFTGATRPVHGLNDALTRLLGELDAVESGGDAGVRDARKALAGDVEGEAARLEGWWRAVWAAKGGEADVVKVRT